MTMNRAMPAAVLLLALTTAVGPRIAPAADRSAASVVRSAQINGQRCEPLRPPVQLMERSLMGGFIDWWEHHGPSNGRTPSRSDSADAQVS
jgi:hypothetical protein